MDDDEEDRSPSKSEPEMFFIGEGDDVDVEDIR